MSSTSVLDLNQDCLNSVFKYLSIYELIAVEKTCSAFKTTCDLVYKSKKFHSFSIKLRYLRKEYLEAIFERIGPTIRALKFSGGYRMDEKIKRIVIETTDERCTRSLRELTLNYVEFDRHSFDKLQKCFHKLTYLDLSHCWISENELQHCLDGERLKSIKTLRLVGNALMNGSFFNQMRHVEVLDVSFCYGLLYYHFLPFIKNCHKLRELNTTASCQLITEDECILSALLEHQPYLQTIVMDNMGMTRDDEILSQFKHLKHSSFIGRKFGT